MGAILYFPYAAYLQYSMPLHSGLSQHRALSVFPGGQICRGRYPDGPAAILPVCRPFAVQHAAMLLSVFNSKRRPLPPQGRTRPQATPRRAAPRRPCGARAFRPRDAWAHPARRRSQPARGRRPVRGAVRRRRDRAKRRRLVTAARESSARARRTEETEIKFLCGMQARSEKPNAVSSPVRQKSSCAVRRRGAESGRRRAETDG